ncbi:HPr kinase/phosphatase C-terminal domain-containing protein [Octadecabacter sp. 1_MG-2023]|uniref:HPr kinase/phosphorylase n=1 Tax=unclassified Octadecabacter TaxID=196158 RepID=UPI001C0A1B2D|nr:MULTISPECIES: HPr kinase/phosphatase C-terminal domain-containing protein [unclassified Octadecabacter]MBU2992623.1 HPr kinase/phosphatase C-terminal domain-containing protein [Octadecabacter sp. B2R22]MDO6734620.1 HPr kinase/phosphatase C-terminal domain-containing protein [Octadecabacter sp. 1_MG-2023]
MLSVAPKEGPDGRLQLHASTVVINRHAVALTGPSGSGKSGHALALMSRGAVLLADDITWIVRTSQGLIAQCPPTLKGRIEARGVGILSVDHIEKAPLRLIVDLGTVETDRIPPWRSIELMGEQVALLHNSETSHFADAIMQYMKHERSD